MTEGGAELPVTNIATATALMLNGPGKWSLDSAFGIRLPRFLAPLGLVVVVLAVMYGGTGGETGQDEAREGTAGNGEA